MGRKVMFVLVVLLLLLNSCGKEEAPQLKEGRVSFSFVMEDGAGTKSVDENLIKNLNLYVVNNAGGVQYFAYLNNPGRVDATIWKDETYSVYVVANAGLPILKNTLSDVENIALLYQTNAPFGNTHVGEDGSKSVGRWPGGGDSAAEGNGKDCSKV